MREREKLRLLREAGEKTAFPETLSYKLRKQRERAGLSRERLASELGISREEIDKIETGEKPSLQTLRKYEQFFKKKFPGEEQKQETQVTLKNEKVSLKELLGRAKDFFSGKKEKVGEISGEELEIV